ncbi:hypothetical protein [Anabaena azotica]|uniref:Uncharacterized protein n=1 Tax=Anabaena azotica FACHB-119 TaxID=947527 RepID=A0ABR8D7D5_9NOST|nr:hypothetical protein [Anabaena azotica]MBD2502846.1 hypothetical protein [Anabaena azotica FACHB-119]
MTDLQTLINNLPKIVYGLRLTLGNSQEIIQQVVLINHAQEQLRQIQQVMSTEAIAQKTSSSTHKATATLPRVNTTRRLLVPSIFHIEPNISGNTKLITEKFGNPEIEICLDTLKSKIDYWIEWGDFLQAIAADILSDNNLINQVNLDTNYPSLTNQIERLRKSINIKLAFSDSRNLDKQIQQILHIEEDISKTQHRLAYVINTIKSSQGLLTIFLAISSFCGQSGFSIEWLDDAHELIISSEGKFQELTDILNDCQTFQDKLTTYLSQCQQLKQQAQKSLNQKNYKRQNIKELTNNLFTSGLGRITILAVATVAILSLGSWTIKNTINQLQQTEQNINPETQALNNFKSALKLGREASTLAQDPPHPLTRWQQAASKWQQAINFLNQIPQGTSVSAKAQERLIRYRRNYQAINEKVASESQAFNNLELAQKLANEAAFFMKNAPNSLSAWQQAKDKWEQAIKLLETIPKNSFVYQQAQATLPNYKTHYAAISAIIQN